MNRSAFACLLLAGLGLAAVPARGQEPAISKEVLALQDAFQGAIAAAEPAIACILVSRSPELRLRGEKAPGQLGGFEPDRMPPRPAFRPRDPQEDRKNKLDLADPSNVPESFGSGVVLDPRGLVLTNYHVVREATKVYVRLPDGTGSYADIHAADPRSDLAVLRLITPKRPLKTIRRGDASRIKKGQLVLSLANPFAAGFRDGSPSASWGIISNIRRRAPAPSRDEERNRTPLNQLGTLLQLDARLNLGCSGGAVINLKGELIGLTTAFAALQGSETAGGFAVALDAAMNRIVDVLKEGREVEYGFLGVSPHPDGRRGNGVLIRTVTSGTPAWNAGIRSSDEILGVEDYPVRDTDDLFLALGIHLAGSRVRIQVRSPGMAARTVTATLAKFYIPDQSQTIVTTRPPAVKGLRVDYTSILVQKNQRFLDPHFPTMLNGVMVREVEENSPAARNGQIKPEDVITHVNNQPVNSPAEFYEKAGNGNGRLELQLASPAREVRID